MGRSRSQATIPTTPAELAEYKLLGVGYCRDKAEKFPRSYYTHYAVGTINGCRGVCTSLSAACVGYSVVVSASYTGINCNVYGSMLPDKGAGAAARGEALDQWQFHEGTGGSDTLILASVFTGRECYAKLPGASGMHPPMPSPPTPSTL